MFFDIQPEFSKKSYERFLKIAGSLSNLFSDSAVPYLYYRVAEKIFCKAFNAEDLSRSDVSADAKKESLGIGLKTFLAGNGRSFQKVAEFNNARHIYKDLEPKGMIAKIAELRNARLDFTAKAHGLNKSIYHCIMRDKGRFLIFEEPMDSIDIPRIRINRKSKGSIIFSDGKNDYSFLPSKSTLTKRFVAEPIAFDFGVEILKNPFEELEKLFSARGLLFETVKRIKASIFLPLYGRNRIVFEKSGLNQWNAGGRSRDANEVYIPIPAEVHRSYPDFFPGRETSFSLKLPNGRIMKSKVCQAGGKALMSYSNKKLGKWILRNVLGLKEGELLTYQKLQAVGVDSVRIDKISNSQFEINFASLGKYESFKEANLSNG